MKKKPSGSQDVDSTTDKPVAAVNKILNIELATRDDVHQRRVDTGRRGARTITLTRPAYLAGWIRRIAAGDVGAAKGCDRSEDEAAWYRILLFTGVLAMFVMVDEERRSIKIDPECVPFLNALDFAVTDEHPERLDDLMAHHEPLTIELPPADDLSKRLLVIASHELRAQRGQTLPAPKNDIDRDLRYAWMATGLTTAIRAEAASRTTKNCENAALAWLSYLGDFFRAYPWPTKTGASLQ